MNQRPETTWCCERAEFKASFSPIDIHDIQVSISDVLSVQLMNPSDESDVDVPSL